ncbi:LAMI_0G13586g1_1 [Lachancea mirantina]|uniref:Presequence translocated-associated motor subunit PAM17 n=1 Tax=Lachancea mirantina TaxID=1230905 RepID=A0A1G4KBV0_9SACH|nr:LAMI_0G13586g1_1 [Lachancea mirantina]
MLSRAVSRSAGVTVRTASRGLSVTLPRFQQIEQKGSKDAGQPAPFNWNDFFKLRKQERKINLGSSIVSAFVGCNISWGYLSTMQIDPTQMIMGFDPLMVVSAALVASGALGYLFGPLFGTYIFKMRHKDRLNDYNGKTKEFLKHVVANRVDSSSQSFSNPVPDYYGEKIGSLKEYRQWLRDCHAFRRKAKEFL